MAEVETRSLRSGSTMVEVEARSLRSRCMVIEEKNKSRNRVLVLRSKLLASGKGSDGSKTRFREVGETRSLRSGCRAWEEAVFRGWGCWMVEVEARSLRSGVQWLRCTVCRRRLFSAAVASDG
jgi:hypothetical protein